MKHLLLALLILLLASCQEDPLPTPGEYLRPNTARCEGQDGLPGAIDTKHVIFLDSCEADLIDTIWISLISWDTVRETPEQAEWTEEDYQRWWYGRAAVQECGTLGRQTLMATAVQWPPKRIGE